MFDASFMELLVVFVIGLLILGPERLPRVAAQLGRWIGKARRTATQLRYQLEREVALEEIYKEQGRRKRPAAPPSNPRAHESAQSAPGAEDDAVVSSADSAASTPPATDGAAGVDARAAAQGAPAAATHTIDPPAASSRAAADTPVAHEAPVEAPVANEAPVADAPPEPSERKSSTG